MQLHSLNLISAPNNFIFHQIFGRDKQGYLVRIVTGSQPNAGTTAMVIFCKYSAVLVTVVMVTVVMVTVVMVTFRLLLLVTNVILRVCR